MNRPQRPLCKRPPAREASAEADDADWGGAAPDGHGPTAPTNVSFGFDATLGTRVAQDGNSYTYSEFVAQYGQNIGHVFWLEASVRAGQLNQKAQQWTNFAFVGDVSGTEEWTSQVADEFINSWHAHSSARGSQSASSECQNWQGAFS